MLQYPYGRVDLDTICLDSTVDRMDKISFSQRLADKLNETIDASTMTKQQVSAKSGIPWTTLCRRLDHPENSFFTVPEVISVCEVLSLDFLDVLAEAESASALAEGTQHD